ncbi:MAG: tetratricopeptide repeat protein [Bacteroidales bacterium]|nr:tetratricopeptide repeat protein [Bacteroidales bacterium]
MKKLPLTFALIVCSMSYLQAQSVKDLKLDAYGYLWAQKYEAATESFGKLIQSALPLPEYYLGRGVAQYYLGHFEDALTDITKAGNEGVPEAALWNARIYAALNDEVAAIRMLGIYLKANPGADIRAIKKDPGFKSLHTHDGWLMLWQDRSSEIDEIETEADYYASRNNFQAAHRAIEDKLHSGLRDSKLYALNASLYEREGNLPLALSEINYALSENPEDKALILKKVMFLEKMGEYTRAYSLIDKLVGDDYTHFDHLLNRAQLGLKAGQLEQAAEDISTILRYSDSPEYIFLGGQIAYEEGDYISALKNYNRLLEKDSANADYLKARGMTYYQTRTYKQAAYDLSMSLDLQPVDPETNYFKGMAEYALGDISMACYYMERAIRKNYLPAIEFSTKNCNAAKSLK